MSRYWIPNYQMSQQLLVQETNTVFLKEVFQYSYQTGKIMFLDWQRLDFWPVYNAPLKKINVCAIIPDPIAFILECVTLTA